MELNAENPLSIVSTKSQLIADVLKRDAAAELDINKRPNALESVIRIGLFVAAIISVFTTIGIVVSLGQQAATFFQMEAWLPARTLNLDTRVASIPLTNALDAAANEISFADESDQLPAEIVRVPYSDGQYIRIGGEVMRVISATRRTISVERGLEGTTASSHDAGTTVEPLASIPIRLKEDLSISDIRIDVEAAGSMPLTQGQIVRIYNEEMMITGISLDEASITVERGYNGTEAAAHPAGEGLDIATQPTIFAFLSGIKWQPEIGEFGVLPLVTATLTTTVIALLVSVPLGLGAAIYLSEYASPQARAALKPILELLAGIPTVVYGFFAVTFMTPLLRSLLGADTVEIYNTAAAGLVMGIMIVPTISSISEDALSAVPRSLREASYGLGATKLETIVRVIVPAALSGIIAAFILGMSRAVGETMIVALAAGVGPNLTFNPFKAAETITGHIARISGGDIAFGTIQYNSVFALGLTLFIITLVLNLVSGYVTRRFREVYQ